MAGRNVFVPGGDPGAPWPREEPENVQVRVGQNRNAGRQRSAPPPQIAGGSDHQDFEELNQAITNIIDTDVGQSIPIENPARTGLLRVTANKKKDAADLGQSLKLDTSGKHLHAKTTYTMNYTYITLYILSIIASLIYIAVRVYYIANGVMRQEIPYNTRVVDTSTCAPADIDTSNCSNEFCGKEETACENIRAGVLLEEIGIDLADPITTDDVLAPEFKGIREIMATHTYSWWWSIIVLAAEIGGFVLVHLSQQMFVRQDTKFYRLEDHRVKHLKQLTKEKGALQRINVMVCTYNEPMETVRLCVEHLLLSKAPVYCEKKIYIGDDGAKKKFDVSFQKRDMCAKFQQQGYDVEWVGDRKALPHQLNGKSSNINHMVLNKMYPHVQRTMDVPSKDVLMVMDCDHLVEEDFFAKACSVMLDKDVAVCLIPQSFHNEVHPDCFDNTNYNFMFRLMPYYFGAGCCFVTGTNVMIRARAAFMACRFDENPHGHETTYLKGKRNDERKQPKTSDDGHRQLFSEVLVAEDIDLGSRVHTLGFKSVFLAEVLAKGEVPRDARSIWKQRSRWASAAHMYILDPSSVFWRRQKNMSFWQKSLYWIPMILHWTLIWAEPVMFSMPIVCLWGDICPYGIDSLLWVTHFLKLVTTFLISSYADTLELSRAAIYGQTMARVLFFVNVKAVLNTIMVYTGWKRPGAFKVTQKAGGAAPAATPEVAVAPQPAPTQDNRDNGGPTIPKILKRMRLYRIHDSLSNITNKRKSCMPWEGTFDFWVLLGITLMNLAAVFIGLYRLIQKEGSLNTPVFTTVNGCQSQNVQLIALVFAFIEATPGLLFIMYMIVEAKAEWVMKIWVPLIIGTISILCILIEFRVGLQYVGQLAGLNYFGDSALCGDVQDRS